MGHSPLVPFAASAGPRSAKLAIVGEAWGESEALTRRPFVGESGKELFRMIGEAMPDLAPEAHAKATAMMRYGDGWVRARDAWLEEAQVFMTNVVASRPPANKFTEWCTSKKELPPGYSRPFVEMGKYLRPEFLPELDRLEEELSEVKPNLVLALGAKATWALLDQTNIGSIRGTTGLRPNGQKVLPSYHPAAVLRLWSWRPILVADLMKAKREMAFAEVRRPERLITVSPTIEEVEDFAQRLREDCAAGRVPLVGCDTETQRRQITCIGFAPSRGEAFVIPFIDLKSEGRNYWPTPDLELRAWNAVGSILEDLKVAKVWQNGLYDYQYVLPLGFALANSHHDTMLLHHSLLPEVKKGLGFLGSIYTDEASWKLMRLEKTDTEKRDE